MLKVICWVLLEHFLAQDEFKIAEKTIDSEETMLVLETKDGDCYSLPLKNSIADAYAVGDTVRCLFNKYEDPAVLGEFTIELAERNENLA